MAQGDVSGAGGINYGFGGNFSPLPQKSQAEKDSEHFIGEMHGAGNSGDAASMRNILASAKGTWAESEVQSIYNQKYGDAEAKEKAAQAAQQRELDVANSKNSMMNQAEDSGRRQLSQKLGQVRSGANSRGLLYSGLRQGAEEGTRAQSAGDLAATRQNINQASDEQMTNLTNQGANQGIQSYGMQIQNNANDYQDALKRYQQKTGALGALGKGLGAAGALLPI